MKFQLYSPSITPSSHSPAQISPACDLMRLPSGFYVQRVDEREDKGAWLVALVPGLIPGSSDAPHTTNWKLYLIVDLNIQK